MAVPPARRSSLPGAVTVPALRCAALLSAGVITLGSLADPVGASPVQPTRVVSSTRAGVPHPVSPVVATTAIPATAAKRPAASDVSDSPSVAGHLVRTGLTPFTLAGVTWLRGVSATRLRVRIRTLQDGRWSSWSTLDADDDGPAASAETSARPGTVPLWTPTATGVDVVVSTPTGVLPTGLAVSTIDPGTSSFDATATASSVASKAATAPGRALTRDGFPELPKIITRSQWGADPALTDKCWDPVYGDSLKMVFIHHTVNANDYTAAQAPALMRGILAYHTQSRGWCDIGYNFVVDRYGNIYEGRRGGIRKPVRGAHTGIYNTDSTGISMLGNFDVAPPTTALKNALVRLVGWRLGTAYESATDRVRLAGKTFDRISGHRDAMATACPGRYGYAFLPTLRQQVAWYLAPMRSHILAAYERAGGPESDLGLVFQGETGLGHGHFTTFQHGRMYYSPVTHRPVTTLMRGAVLAKYRALGGPASTLGYPRTSGLSFANGVKEVRFQHGNIYASTATGAHAIESTILHKYYALNSFTGRLGLPISDTVTTATSATTDFVNGQIVYLLASKRFTVTYKK